MALKTIITTLIIMGAAAVNPLQAAIPMPGFSMASQGSNMFMSASSGLMDGMTNMRSMSSMVRSQSVEGFNQAASQLIGVPQTVIKYASKLTMGALSTYGRMDVTPNAVFNVTLTASMSNGICNLDVKVTPTAMNMGLDMSGLGQLGKEVAETPSAMSFVTSSLTGALKDILPPILAGIIMDSMNSPSSPISADAMCQAIMNNNIPNLPSMV